MAALGDEVRCYIAQGRQVTVGVVANGGVVAMGDPDRDGISLPGRTTTQMPPHGWRRHRSVMSGRVSQGEPWCRTVTPASQMMPAQSAANNEALKATASRMSSLLPESAF